MRRKACSDQRLAAGATGFTIVELLVAAAITAVLAGLMLALVGNVLTGWNRSRGVLTTEAEARIALDRLAEDLQGALYRNDGNAWLAATMQTDTGASGLWSGGAKPSAVMIDPALEPDIAGCRFGLAAMWLRFITARPAATLPASEAVAPVAVSYQLIHRSPVAGGTGAAHYLLFRGEALPSATFAGGYNLDPAASPAPAYMSGLLQPALAQILADNVVDFGVRLYARDPANGSLVLLYPTTANATATYLGKSLPAAASATGRFPEVADVMMRVLTDEGVRRIQAHESNPAPGADWWTIALANSRVFTRRIELHPGAL